ncbi:DMP19 family protein [Myxococcota bacterium]|nr:DMP19 family protein [Myxococcota bacterium]MBU1380907.1 DMP19 family protein [Myxococcota bacterium]MBU1496250.1 DMP19 family protein [Myxococcota bacterium]
MKYLNILLPVFLLFTGFTCTGKRSKTEDVKPKEADISTNIEVPNVKPHTPTVPPVTKPENAKSVVQSKKLDPKALTKMKDDDIEDAIIDAIQSLFDEDYSDEFEVVSRLSKSFRVIYSTRILENEVKNGGWNQFFWNSSHLFTKEAEAGLQAIGATEQLKFLKEAIVIHDQEKDLKKKYREQYYLYLIAKEDPSKAKEIMQHPFSEYYKQSKLKTLNSPFFKIKDNLGQLRIKYIRAHIKDFSL